MQAEVLAGGTVVYVEKSCRFGQDALLLAHFCGVRAQEAVCDLGTGCGVIPLRWHDRGHRGACLALDIAPGAAALLERSLAANGIGHITALCGDLRDRALLAPHAQRFDAVACNPPYFTGGLTSPDAARAGARHELSCTLSDVCAAAFTLLRDGGRLCLCQRPERLTDVLTAMRAARIEPKRLQFVTAGAGRAPWLFLVEGKKNRAPGLRLLPQLVTARADGTPSAAMQRIYGFAAPKRKTEEDAL